MLRRDAGARSALCDGFPGGASPMPGSPELTTCPGTSTICRQGPLALAAAYDAMQQALKRCTGTRPHAARTGVDTRPVSALSASVTRLRIEKWWDRAYQGHAPRSSFANPTDLDVRSVFVEAIAEWNAVADVGSVDWRRRRRTCRELHSHRGCSRTPSAIIRHHGVGIIPRRTLASLCSSDGNVAVSRNGRSGPVTGCVTLSRMPDTSSICQLISTYSASITAMSSSTTRRQSSPIRKFTCSVKGR